MAGNIVLETVEISSASVAYCGWTDSVFARDKCPS